MTHDLLSQLAPMFYPKSVAIIGASNDTTKFAGVFLPTLLAFGYPGKVYPVNPQENQVSGLKAYATISDIPDAVDFAIILVPAHAVPDVIRECVAKGITVAEIQTSGFAEAGQEGRKLEEQVVAAASNKLRIVGPNCFGVYCPASGLTILPGTEFPRESGPVAFISQSGGYTTRFVRRGRGLGIRFSKVVSYGNACDISECDLLEYLGQDPETRIITGYIEGVKDAPRFYTLLQQIAKVKPVILWKSGITEGGARAADSHTGSLRSAETAWEAVFKQTPALRAHSIEELLDTTLAFLHLAPHQGRKISVVGGGGGITVTATDTCEKLGLSVPPFSHQVQRKLSTFIQPVGASFRNPVDVGHPFPTPSVLQPVLETIATQTDINTVIISEIELVVADRSARHIRESYGRFLNKTKEVPVEIKKRLGLPIIMVLPVEATDSDATEIEAARREIRDYYHKAGIPVYTTLERAAKALANVVGYYEALDSFS